MTWLNDNIMWGFIGLVVFMALFFIAFFMRTQLMKRQPQKDNSISDKDDGAISVVKGKNR